MNKIEDCCKYKSECGNFASDDCSGQNLLRCDIYQAFVDEKESNTLAWRLKELALGIGGVVN